MNKHQYHHYSDIIILVGVVLLFVVGTYVARLI